MKEKNVIYITGNTYDHREEINQFAFFDAVLGLYVAPISKKEEVEAIVSKYKLESKNAFQKDFIEPSNPQEWEIRRTESKINSVTYRLNNLESEISGNQDIESNEIKDKQISINSLKETIETLKDKKKRLEEDYENGKTSSFCFRSMAEIEEEDGEDWFSVAPPPQPMLLTRRDGKDFLPKGIVSMLCAMGGTGKSRFCAQLAFSIAAGIPFLGEFNHSGEGTGRVFFGLGEEPMPGVRRRLFSVGQYFGHDRETKKIDFKKAKKNIVPFSFYGQNVVLIDEKGNPTAKYHDLKRELQRSQGDGYDLVILDPISRFIGGTTETDNDNATKFIAILERLSLELKGNPTILMVHHTTKHTDWKSQHASRGSSSLTAGVRWQLNLVRADEAKEAKEKDESTKKELRLFVKGDLVKINDVPPLEYDIILKFEGKGGVLVPACEHDIMTHFPRCQKKIEKQKENKSNYTEYM